MHAVLRHFVDAARRRFLMEAEKLIERAGTLADLVGLFDGFGDVGLGEHHGFAQLRPHASCAAIADENVHPDPWVFGLFT